MSNQTENNTEEDLCSCGYDWSKPSSPKSEVSQDNDYLINGWDLSNVIRLDEMFNNIKTIIGHNEDGSLIVSPIDAASVLIKQGDKFLGVSRKDDHSNIGLPSGKRDHYESFEECAVRETLEETGYTVRLIDTQPFALLDKNSDMYCITHLAEILDVPQQPLSPSETAVFGFYDKQAFIDGSFGDYNVKMFKHFGF